MKEEERRAEYRRFCDVCDAHSSLLSDTSQYCSAYVRATDLVDDAVGKGFGELEADFQRRTEENAELCLATHKAHLETFRGLFLSLGELTHKLERRREDTEKQIEAATINLELCADTLNPEAKRFSDVKRELVATREKLLKTVKDLKMRTSRTLECFQRSEAALAERGVEFTHPLLEQHEKKTAERERMLKIREIAAGKGGDENAPVEEEIKGLHRDLEALRARVGVP